MSGYHYSDHSGRLSDLQEKARKLTCHSRFRENSICILFPERQVRPKPLSGCTLSNEEETLTSEVLSQIEGKFCICSLENRTGLRVMSVNLKEDNVHWKFEG
jgi:hypothetical protein